jgi:hypothetical protein
MTRSVMLNRMGVVKQLSGASTFAFYTYLLCFLLAMRLKIAVKLIKVVVECVLFGKWFGLKYRAF